MPPPQIKKSFFTCFVCLFVCLLFGDHTQKCSGTITSSVHRDHSWCAVDRTRVICVQGKSFNCCTSALAPAAAFLYLRFHLFAWYLIKLHNYNNKLLNGFGNKLKYHKQVGEQTSLSALQKSLASLLEAGDPVKSCFCYRKILLAVTGHLLRIRQSAKHNITSSPASPRPLSFYDQNKESQRDSGLGSPSQQRRVESFKSMRNQSRLSLHLPHRHFKGILDKRWRQE